MNKTFLSSREAALSRVAHFIAAKRHVSPAGRFIARSACILFIALAMGSCQEEENVLYEILDKIDQIAELGTWQNTVNGNIGALQTIVAAQQGNVYVTGMEKFDKPAPGGYTINFTDGTKATVKHNADSTAGATGATPQIGVKDDGGSYYWTLNGNWLYDDDSGDKIPVAGDHSITPQLRINLEADYYWEMCTTGACDEEAGWTSLGIRTLDDDDEIRPQGDIVFAENGINELPGYVEFILADGVTKIKVSKYVTPPVLNGRNRTLSVINAEMVHVDYTVPAAITGGTLTGAPAGVSGSFTGNTFSVYGTPTEAGVFTYTVTLTVNDNNCAATATGVLEVENCTNCAVWFGADYGAYGAGIKYVSNVATEGRMNWPDANAFCTAKGEGWRLPDDPQLKCMCSNKAILPGGHASWYYWSSRFRSPTYAPGVFYQTYDFSNMGICSPISLIYSERCNFKCVK